MKNARIPFIGLDQYPDFELYTTEEREDRIVKRYTGDDWDVKRCLKNEFEWLHQAPPYLNYHFPGLFQDAILLQDDENGVELHLTKPNRKSVAQQILSGVIDEKQAVKYMDSALFILCEYLYPLHTEEEKYNSVNKEMFISFFFDRTSLLDVFYKAKERNFKHPSISTILNSHKIIVNETVCPSVVEIIDFIKIKNLSIKASPRMHTIHGNFFLNNILAESGTQTQTELITFTNPKNYDLQWIYPDHFLGFPVIDFSCLLLNMECYLDEIHYGGFQFENGSFSYDCYSNFQINNHYSKVYEKGLQFLHSKRAYFAELQGVSMKDFTILTLCTEWLQLLNKIIVLDRNKWDETLKSLVMLGILGLLGKRLIEAVNNIDAFEFSDKRLEVNINQIKK